MNSLSVSDHALVRFIERVHGFDLEPFRHMIREACGDAAQAGSCRVKKGAWAYCIAQEDGRPTVVTVMRRKKKGGKQ